MNIQEIEDLKDCDILKETKITATYDHERVEELEKRIVLEPELRGVFSNWFLKVTLEHTSGAYWCVWIDSDDCKNINWTNIKDPRDYLSIRYTRQEVDANFASIVRKFLKSQ